MASPSLLSGVSYSTNSPCAACKFLRRKCQPGCIFAPYFKPDQSNKFISVHRIFGASNVSKLLNELPPNHREDAASSLVYEAEMRIRDPVYGCVGIIYILQRDLRNLQLQLSVSRAELARYQSIAAAALQPENLAMPQNGFLGLDGYFTPDIGGVMDDGEINALSSAAAACGLFGDQFMRPPIAGVIENTGT